MSLNWKKFIPHWKCPWTPRSWHAGHHQCLLLGPVRNCHQNLQTHWHAHLTVSAMHVSHIWCTLDLVIFPLSHHHFPTIPSHMTPRFPHHLNTIFPLSCHHFPTTPYDPTIFPPSRRAPRQKTRRPGDSAQILSRKLIRTRCHPLNNFHLQHLAFISLTVSARV